MNGPTSHTWWVLFPFHDETKVGASRLMESLVFLLGILNNDTQASVDIRHRATEHGEACWSRISC